MPGQRREDDRKEQTLRESAPEEETYPLIPVGAVRVRKGAETSDGASVLLPKRPGDLRPGKRERDP